MRQMQKSPNLRVYSVSIEAVLVRTLFVVGSLMDAVLHVVSYVQSFGVQSSPSSLFLTSLVEKQVLLNFNEIQGFTTPKVKWSILIRFSIGRCAISLKRILKCGVVHKAKDFENLFEMQEYYDYPLDNLEVERQGAVKFVDHIERKEVKVIVHMEELLKKKSYISNCELLLLLFESMDNHYKNGRPYLLHCQHTLQQH